MEKHSGVFERFIAFENQIDGYKLAAKDKRYRPEVLDYSYNLEDFIIDGINSLIWKEYHVDHVHEFMEYFPKKRIITAWPFKYRVINCAAYNVLWPIYSKSFYEHSYGSIPGKGQVKACLQLQQWIRKAVACETNRWYIGKADIAKFFFRIPHEIQLRELARPLDDPDMMWFLQQCLKGDGRPTGLPLDISDVSDAERIFGIGMPVGSLISQMTANVVLTPLDHYMKRVVRVPRYIRYMDDMIILAPSKAQVWDALGMMDDYLRNELGLQLNNKTAVLPCMDGVEFIGRVIYPDQLTVRKQTSLQIKRHLRYIAEKYSAGEVELDYAVNVMQSYLGLLKYTSCKALREKICETYILVRNSPEDIRSDPDGIWL